MKKPSRPKKTQRTKKAHHAKRTHLAKKTSPTTTPETAFHKTIVLTGGQPVEIRFWADANRIFVAAFDAEGDQVTAVTYSAEVDLADDLYSALKDPLIESLARAIEYDLLNNPQLHYRP